MYPEGRKYKKDIDMNDFSNDSNFSSLFSIGNRLEKSGGRFELSKKSC